MPGLHASVPLASFLGIFSGNVTFTFGPHRDEPLIIANKIESLGARLDNWEMPLLGARQILVEDMNTRFRTKKDLSGRAWKQRSQAYKQYLRDRGYTNLNDTMIKDGYLLAAVTDINSYKIVGKDLFIDPSNWPVYWRAHDQGQSVGRATVLPQRQFVGMSEVAQYEVISIFDHWMIGNLDITVGASGVAMYRGAFGQFGGKISIGMPHPRITRESVQTIVSRPS
jgi:hypothetical protein